MKVLIVDDDPQIRNLLSSFLTRVGWSVETAADIEEARRKLGGSVEVVLSDYMMDKLNGADLLQEIRQRYPEIEVVLMSGFEDLHSTVEPLGVKAFAYLRKPFDLTELNRTLVAALRNSGSHPSAESRQESAAAASGELQSILDALPEALYVIGGDGLVSHCNRSAVELTGLDRDSLIGQDLSRILECGPFGPSRQVGTKTGRPSLAGLINRALAGRGKIIQERVELVMSSGKTPDVLSFRATCRSLTAPLGASCILLLETAGPESDAM